MASTAAQRRWRLKYPKKAAYATLRDNAKRRGHDFTITFEYFEAFCYRYKYIGKKGRSKDGYGVDRIQEHLGYIPGNIAIKKNGNNTRKYKEYIAHMKQIVTQVISEDEDRTDLPFG